MLNVEIEAESIFSFVFLIHLNASTCEFYRVHNNIVHFTVLIRVENLNLFMHLCYNIL